MDDSTKRDFIQLFNQGFEDVVIPHIERIEQRLGKLETSVENLETRVYQIDNKLDRMLDKQLDHDKQLAEHSNSLNVIKSISAIAHEINK